MRSVDTMIDALGAPREPADRTRVVQTEHGGPRARPARRLPRLPLRKRAWRTSVLFPVCLAPVMATTGMADIIRLSGVAARRGRMSLLMS